MIAAAVLDRTADGGAPPAADEAHLLACLRRGDEVAFRDLVERHHGAMVRVAMSYVPSRAVAEEVVQETWLGVLCGLDRFEGRSTLKTWVFRILINRAKSRGVSESRCVALSCLAGDDGPGVDPEQFLAGDDPATSGAWAVEPRPFGDLPADGVVSAELAAHIAEAIEVLPVRQRQVITLRDVEGWSSTEVCDALGLSEANQRVLLHRARTAVRGAIGAYLGQEA